MKNCSNVTIVVDKAHSVSGVFVVPDEPVACFVLAHGAGAGMTHPFMVSVAGGLAERRVATLRYQFPFMEQGLRRPDRPPMAQATVSAAVDTAARRLPNTELFAGGKSFGGRMTSQAQADMPLPSVRGLIFLGYPLHPAGKPSDARAVHLDRVDIPMLFVQGSRDTLADAGILALVMAKLDGRATLVGIDHADHSFHVPVLSGRTDPEVLAFALDALAAWIGGLLPAA